MANTPYLTQDRRDYISRHGLEDMVTVAVNNLMREEPAEPASYLAKHFSGVLSPHPARRQQHQAPAPRRHAVLPRRKAALPRGASFVMQVETAVAYKGQSYTFKYVHEMLQEYDNPTDQLM